MSKFQEGDPVFILAEIQDDEVHPIGAYGRVLMIRDAWYEVCILAPVMTIVDTTEEWLRNVNDVQTELERAKRSKWVQFGMREEDDGD